jgi:hypothetical protein
MKIFTCLLFLFFIGSVSAQYQSIFSDAKKTIRTCTPNGDMYSTMEHTPNDTLLIDSNKYNIVNILYGQSIVLTGALYLYEDVGNAKLWCSKNDTSASDNRLIMDLNLQLGDTFYFSVDSTTYHIVDSVFYNNGLKNIRFNGNFMFGNIIEPILFTESIGPNIGLDYMFPEFLSTSMLVCMQRGNSYEYLYHDSTFRSFCFPVGNYEINEKEKDIRLYPNPANETINIESSVNIQSIEIYDLAGQLLIHQQLNTKYSTIDIEQLTKAVYIVKIKLGEYDTQVHKFIKQ